MDRLSINISPPYLPQHNGYNLISIEQACVVLSLSFCSGNYTYKLHVKTLRKTVTGFTNAYGALGVQPSRAENDNGADKNNLHRSHLLSFTTVPCRRLPWFKRFI